MRWGALLLARRYLAHHRGRTSILVLCIALTALLPLSVEWLIATWGTVLRERADATPLVAGADGSRFDLVLNTLYFRGRVPDPVPMRTVRSLAESGLCQPIPVLARDTAKGLPLVGTSSDYFDFRGLRAARGTLPVLLGECVLGSAAAERLGLGPGDALLTDRGSLYALEAGYPLRMHVVGVLAPSGSPDDGAVFAALETVWIAEGIGHGHGDAALQDPDAMLHREGDRVVLDPSIFEFQEITPDNADTFHFHEEPDDLPVTAVIVVPDDARAATILRARYRVADDMQMLVPREIVDEITAFVFRLKTFFDANVVLVGIATLALLGLVVALSIRVRQREIETLTRIGCARGTVARILATELAIVVGLGLLLAVALAAILLAVLRAWLMP